MKIFVVEISNAETNSVISIHQTYKGALKSWDKERLRLIEQEKHMKLYNEKYSGLFKLSGARAIFNLSCEDPKQIDNYPLDTPIITEYELEE